MPQGERRIQLSLDPDFLVLVHWLGADAFRSAGCLGNHNLLQALYNYPQWRKPHAFPLVWRLL